MKRAAALLIFALIMMISGTSSATIMGTDVDTHAKIDYHQEGTFVTYDETHDSGVLSSNSVVYDSETGARVSSSLAIQDLTNETATFNFEVNLKSPDSSPTEFVPDPANRAFYRLTASNKTKFSIVYSAETDSTLNVRWDFSYTGINPFGLQTVNLSPSDDLWNPWLTLGDYGVLGQHTGEQDFNLLAGEEYLFDLYLYSNYQGYMYKDSWLTGNIFLISIVRKTISRQYQSLRQSFFLAVGC